MTEKLFYQGYSFAIVPIVLRRNIVEKYLPPNSFIAVDDYQNVNELVDYLQFLIKNKQEYM